MTLPWNRRRWLASSGASMALGGKASHAGSDDEPWFDADRRRELPMRLRWPRGPGPWPLVLYSHGLGGSRNAAEVWGEAWAAAGLVVVNLQHPGSDGEVLRQGRGALRAAANWEQLAARVADVRFVLDELARRHARRQGLWSDVDPKAIGMAGHSFGARTVQALAGERFAVASEFVEPRITAFVALSPSRPRAPLTSAQAFSAIERPFFVITGSLDGDPFGAYAGGEPRAKVFEGLPRGRRALLWLEGADHASFAGTRDRRANGAWAREAAAVAREADHHRIVAALTTLWWRQHLHRDARAAGELRDQPGIVAPDRFIID